MSKNFRHDLNVGVAEIASRINRDARTSTVLSYEDVNRLLQTARVQQRVVAADQRDLATRWFNLRTMANRGHARLVEARSMQAFSLTFAAQDFGIVPHGESDVLGKVCPGCTAHSRINRIAASLIRWEASHRTGSTTISAWAMAVAS